MTGAFRVSHFERQCKFGSVATVTASASSSLSATVTAFTTRDDASGRITSTHARSAGSGTGTEADFTTHCEERAPQVILLALGAACNTLTLRTQHSGWEPGIPMPSGCYCESRE